MTGPVHAAEERLAAIERAPGRPPGAAPDVDAQRLAALLPASSLAGGEQITLIRMAKVLDAMKGQVLLDLPTARSTYRAAGARAMVAGMRARPNDFANWVQRPRVVIATARWRAAGALARLTPGERAALRTFYGAGRSRVRAATQADGAVDTAMRDAYVGAVQHLTAAASRGAQSRSSTH